MSIMARLEFLVGLAISHEFIVCTKSHKLAFVEDHDPIEEGYKIERVDGTQDSFAGISTEDVFENFK